MIIICYSKLLLVFKKKILQIIPITCIRNYILLHFIYITILGMNIKNPFYRWEKWFAQGQIDCGKLLCPVNHASWYLCSPPLPHWFWASLCLGQWDICKYDASRGLITAIRTWFLGMCLHYIKKPTFNKSEDERPYGKKAQPSKQMF